MNSPSDRGTPTRAQTMWPLAAAVPFLLSLALLGIAANTGKLLPLAIGWPLIQLIGYGGSLKLAHGDTAHPLFVAQVVLNYLALGLLALLITKGLRA